MKFTHKVFQQFEINRIIKMAFKQYGKKYKENTS